MAVNYTPKEITSLLGFIDTFIRWEEKYKNDRHYAHYHPSEWGKCLRLQQYKHYQHLGLIQVEKQSFDSQKLRLFQKGHNMQSRWEGYFERAGVLRGVWKCRNPMCLCFNDEGEFSGQDKMEEIWGKDAKYPKTRRHGTDQLCGVFKPDKCACHCKDFDYEEVAVVDKELNMSGHADIILDFSRVPMDFCDGVRSTFNLEILPKRPIVIDMKTIGDFQFKNKVQKNGPHPEYIVQLSIYADILKCEYGVLIYENKNDSDVASFKVEKDPQLVEDIRWQAKMMIEMAKDLKNPKLPPPKAESQTDYECRNCDFSDICHKSGAWRDPNLQEKRDRFYKSLLKL